MASSVHLRRTAVAARLQIVWALVLSSILAACSGVKLVADYDAEAVKGITDTSAAVFGFYDRMISARAALPPSAALPYAPYAEEWGKIETQIRVMLVREESRPLNSDSAAITKTILELWNKYRQAHLTKNDYNPKLLLFHRDRFQRLFAAALRAEKAKQLPDSDKNPASADDEH